MRAKIKDLAFSREGENILTLSTREDCRAIYDELHEYDVEVTIRKHRQKRSLDANAYAWVLIHKLSEATGTPVSEVYRRGIRDIGGNAQIVCVQDKAVEKLCEAWEKHGLGWVTDTTKSKLEGCTNVVLYYGSSTFDTAQMSRLIDGLVQDCRAVGVETMPPDKLAALVGGWDGR